MIIPTFLSFDETFPNVQRDVSCAIQNYVCYSSPCIGRELFRRRNEISCSVVDHHLSMKEHTLVHAISRLNMVNATHYSHFCLKTISAQGSVAQYWFPGSCELYLRTSGSPTSVTRWSTAAFTEAGSLTSHCTAWTCNMHHIAQHYGCKDSVIQTEALILVFTVQQQQGKMY